MTDDDLRTLREELQRRRRALLETVRRAAAELDALRAAERDPEFEEGAQSEHEQFTLARLSENQRRELVMIDGAIARIDEGGAIARTCQQLDRIALEKNVSAISDLGLEDDLKGTTPQWRDPQDGLRTVRVLLSIVRENPETLGESQHIVADLERMESALEKAREQGTRFCLVVRVSGDTRVVPEGVDVSKGSFW